MTIFERIKKLADKQGKSLQKVSADLGFGENYFYTLKKQQPKADKLSLIADYFGVSVDYLLGRNTPDFIIEDVPFTIEVKRRYNFSSNQKKAIDLSITVNYDEAKASKELNLQIKNLIKTAEEHSDSLFEKYSHDTDLSLQVEFYLVAELIGFGFPVEIVGHAKAEAFNREWNQETKNDLPHKNTTMLNNPAWVQNVLSSLDSKQLSQITNIFNIFSNLSEKSQDELLSYAEYLAVKRVNRDLSFNEYDGL